MAWVRGKTVLRDIDGDGFIDVVQIELLDKENGERATFEHVLPYAVSETGEIISDERKLRSDWTEEELDTLASRFIASHNI